MKEDDDEDLLAQSLAWWMGAVFISMALGGLYRWEAGVGWLGLILFVSLREAHDD